MSNCDFYNRIFDENKNYLHNSLNSHIELIIKLLKLIEYENIDCEKSIYKLNNDYIEISIKSININFIDFYIIIDKNSFELYLGENSSPVIDYHSLKNKEDHDYLNVIINFLFCSIIIEESKRTLLGNKINFYKENIDRISLILSVEKIQPFKKELEYNIIYKPWIKS